MTVNDIQKEITVIVTCHNEENYIEDSIKSILRQSIFRLIKEIIVVIDNSTDNSINIVKAYEKKFPKFKYPYFFHRHSPRSGKVCLNKSVSQCSGSLTTPRVHLPFSSCLTG